jgi:DNA-directed RNA polymerase subunit beta'
VLIPLEDRLLGRVLAADVVHPETGEIIAERNEALSPERGGIALESRR